MLLRLNFTGLASPSLASSSLVTLVLVIAAGGQHPPDGRGTEPWQRPDTGCAPRAGIQVGDAAVHAFSTPVENGLGTQSLEDLRGKPVMIDFWGVRCAPCVGAAVPASLKLQETYGEDLQVLLVECQGPTPDAGMSFALGQKWMGGRAMWTSERPFDTGTGALPVCVLLGNDGRVLLKGNPMMLHKEIERQIAAQIELRKSPPPNAEPAVRIAWSEFAKDRYGRAFRAASQAEAENAGDAVQLAAIARARGAFREQIDAQIARLRWLVDNAWFDEAEAQLDALGSRLEGCNEHEKEMVELRARLSAPDLAPERRAARQLARLRARFFESGGDAGVAREIERFADKHEGSPTGARAGELLRLAGSCRPR